MLIIKRFRIIRSHHFTGVISALSHNAFSSFTLNCTARNLSRLCTEVRTLSIAHEKYKHKVDPNARQIVHSLLRTNDALTHDKLALLQQKRCLSIAAALVNNASPKVQPYMKLMRIDKPIGKEFNYSLGWVEL